MLTVDYDRLRLRPGELVLDLGSGAGRHAFETLRRGARVVAVDRDAAELARLRAQVAAMAASAELEDVTAAGTARGDAVHLPFPDSVFDRVIAAEVLEHIPDDEAAVAELVRVLKPGGTIAVTVPAWLPETICWKLSEHYHAPSVDGGHVRIYRRGHLRTKLGGAGLEVGGQHHAHALHSPYWWLRCAIDPRDCDDNPLVRAYHRLLTWDITHAPALTRVTERILDPVLGKSLVVYATKPTAPARPGAAVAT